MTLGRRHLLTGVSCLVLLTGLPGCRDKGKVSAEEGRGNVKLLVELAEKDVGEIERGLPEGAKRMAAQLAKEKDPDPRQSSAQVRSALLKMRQQVPDLGVAKSTFFAFTDDKGIAYRNDFEHDTMAGKDIVSAWPDFKKAVAGERVRRDEGHVSRRAEPAGRATRTGSRRSR